METNRQMVLTFDQLRDLARVPNLEGNLRCDFHDSLELGRCYIRGGTWTMRGGDQIIMHPLPKERVVFILQKTPPYAKCVVLEE
jgi:hypothetical protein